MLGVELRDAEGQPDYARCEAVKLRCAGTGPAALTCGAKIGNPRVNSANIRLIPALNTTDACVDQALDILESALRAVPVA